MIGVRGSDLNGFGGGCGACGADLIDGAAPRVNGEEAGLPLGLDGGDTGLPPGFPSGDAQYPQNTVPSGLSLPHCLHAGISSPWPHR
jgi:hypothetical protein